MSDSEKNIKGVSVSIGGMAAVIAASVCCIGPALFIVFGITGLGFLSKLEFLRPYTLALTFILVVMSYYYAYGSGARCDDGTCSLPARRMNRIFFWSLVVIVTLGLTFPFIIDWVYR